jgi:hypothetical protein
MSATILATIELHNRRGRVLAAFRAERGPDGAGVAHLVYRDGALRPSGYSGLARSCADSTIIAHARECAIRHNLAYGLKATIFPPAV